MSEGFINNPWAKGEWSVENLEDTKDGLLQVGLDNKAFRKAADESSAFGVPNRPSLSGRTPHPGTVEAPRGIAGSSMGAGNSSPTPRPAPAMESLSPDQLMALAKQMENDLMARQKAEEGSTYVDPALIRTSGQNAYGGTITEDAPDWLVKYMEGQPSMGEAQFGGPGVDKVKAKQYLSEQEMLRQLKAKQ